MTLKPFEKKKIILGITGSIAAYKAVELASRVTQAGGNVTAILTESGSKMVSGITFAAVTGQKAYTDADLWSEKEYVPHVFLARDADLLIIAPATANFIAKLAHGIADDVLSVTALAYGNGTSEKPLIIAPAMDGGMYLNNVTQENLATLQKRGAIIIGPEEGHLASGLAAKGRMTEPVELFARLRYLLSRDGELHGKQIIVTAGGTREPIDPVRVLSNRSSGKQGYAIAQEALDRGADVTLISGPTHLQAPFAVNCIPVQTAKEMETEVLSRCNQADVLVMAAAVSDFTIPSPDIHKIKRQKGKLSINLVSTEDILQKVATSRKKSQKPDVVIGFAAETQTLLKNAQQKMADKDLDMIVANDISHQATGFEVDNNQVTVLTRDGGKMEYPVLSKAEVAEKIIDQLVDFIKMMGEKN